MEVSELKELKEELQEAISSEIEKRVAYFESQTGVTINKIDVSIYRECYVAGARIPIEFDVYIDLDI